MLPPLADHPAGGEDFGAEQRPAVQEGGGPQVHCRVHFPCHPMVHKWALLRQALGRLACHGFPTVSGASFFAG